MVIEIVKFIIYSGLIVLISKYILVKTIRKLAESLNLKAKTVGNIAGYATSVPEFLTIVTANIRGLSSASVYNILSSNIINFVQYLGAVILNKNKKKLKNKAIKTDLYLVAITIIIPIWLLKFDIELNLYIVPVFIILYILFRFINNNTHKLYLQKDNYELYLKVKKEKRDKTKTIKYFIYLFLTGILLYIIGELLGNTIENLCNLFNVSQVIIGILLGVMTSLPELITFIEAQKHHESFENDMLGVVEATNNLLTSNILNLFVIQTIGILINIIL